MSQPSGHKKNRQVQPCGFDWLFPTAKHRDLTAGHCCPPSHQTNQVLAGSPYHNIQRRESPGAAGSGDFRKYSCFGGTDFDAPMPARSCPEPPHPDAVERDTEGGKSRVGDGDDLDCIRWSSSRL
ncbi:hypothetical protein BT67DRAFT_443164 [Trichocladium antarcticum]|uniref:Uncharacterized protein n=1 Tax=Trichocladium antarcticum TaxID=1450529 RepID=A0AAN6ZCI6_9PEZI|nr:hypothetical protein BT67DRAFT_443164 [Trichocladium antarcticum]